MLFTLFLLIFWWDRGFFQHWRRRLRGDLLRLAFEDAHDGLSRQRLCHPAARQSDGGPLPSVSLTRRALVSMALRRQLGGLVVEDLLWLALGLCPLVRRCGERGEGIKDGFSGQWHLGLRVGVSTGQCLEGGLPTFLVPGASLWALLSETAKGGDIGRELRNVCGNKERGAVRRLRGPLQTNKQPRAAAPRVSRGHSG